MNDYQGKVVLVTGAGHGLGREAALAFAAQGAVVAINDINPLVLDELVEIGAVACGRLHAYCFDVAKRMPVMALVSQVVEELGRIDIVINNAAVEPVTGILEMDEWDWHRTIDVNLSGAFFVMQQAGRVMSEHGGGVIVNVGANRTHNQPQRAAYLASKEGLLSLTRQAARELAEDRIRVHAVCPGQISVEVMKQLHAQIGNIPLAEKKAPESIIEFVLFLCSQQSANLTGIVINCENDG